MGKYLDLIAANDSRDAQSRAPTSTTVPSAPASPVAVELVYVEPQPKVTPVSPEFPPCRKCGARRYWITASGKVVCGGRGCGEVCYILGSISYHPIN